MPESCSINILLLDGDPDGIRIASIAISTIQALAFRRNQLRSTREEFREIEKPGVYILIGIDESDPDRMLAYIGASTNVGGRLITHNSNEQNTFWTDTVALISNDETLTRSHALFVESSLIRAADLNPRWSLRNDANPSENAGNLSRWDRVAMEKFGDQTKILVGALGWDLFRVMRGSPTSDGPIFVYKGGGFDAKMQIGLSGDFVIQAGSKARIRTTPSILPGTEALRKRLLEVGILQEKEGALLFTSSYSFPSPSAASSAVGGSDISGRRAWILADDKRTYADWETEELRSSSATDESE